MLKVNFVYVLAKIIYVLANVIFAKLAIGWGWVGVDGWVVLTEHKEWLSRAIQFEENCSSGLGAMPNKVYEIISRVRVGVNRGQGRVGVNLW